MKSVSAIIISYQGIDFIADCVTTLKSALGRYDHEIIVVDNHSTDGTVEYIVANHPDVRLIINPVNRGFAFAINQGIAAATKSFLWLLNQDLRFRTGCLDALFACRDSLERPGVIGPRLVGFDGKLQRSCRRFPRYHHLLFELTGLAYLFPQSRWFNGWKMGEFDHTVSLSVDQPMGAVMLVGRDMIDEIGVFDESFGIFFNDVDFCRRAREAGYTNHYCAEAVVEHFVGGSVSRRKAKMVWLSHAAMFRYFLKQEKAVPSTPLRLVRLPLAYLAGAALVAAAVPRSLYHLIRKLI
jgi:GT2 family glycosyltransferase